MKSGELEQLRSGYDSSASKYDRFIRLFVPSVRKYREHLTDTLRPGNRVLLVACGTGLDLPHIIRRIGPEGRIVAVDYSEGMLAEARKRALTADWSKVEFYQSDAAKMDFKHEFDAAFCSFAMSVLPDYHSVYRAMLQSLKPGGLLGILDVKSARRKWLTRLFHWFTTLFLPDYDESRCPWIRMQSELEDFRLREYYFSYMYVATGRTRL